MAFYWFLRSWNQNCHCFIGNHWFFSYKKFVQAHFKMGNVKNENKWNYLVEGAMWTTFHSLWSLQNPCPVNLVEHSDCQSIRRLEVDNFLHAHRWRPISMPIRQPNWTIEPVKWYPNWLVDPIDERSKRCSSSARPKEWRKECRAWTWVQSMRSRWPENTICWSNGKRDEKKVCWPRMRGNKWRWQEKMMQDKSWKCKEQFDSDHRERWTQQRSPVSEDIHGAGHWQAHNLCVNGKNVIDFNCKLFKEKRKNGSKPAKPLTFGEPRNVWQKPVFGKTLKNAWCGHIASESGT